MAGQKIFAITQSVYANNLSIVSSSLSAHSQSTRDRIQQALDAGYEVTIHEAHITEDGWTGAGFTIIDPATGAGGYLIDGGSNGAVLGLLILTFVFAIAAIAILAWAGPFAFLGYGWMLVGSFATAATYLDAINAHVNWTEVADWIGISLGIIGLAVAITALGVVLGFWAAIFAAVVGLIAAIYSKLCGLQVIQC